MVIVCNEKYHRNIADNQYSISNDDKWYTLSCKAKNPKINIQTKLNETRI